MIKVGITGGIGSGKSTIAKFYETLGYPVYFADDRAKWLMNNDPIVKEELIHTFGKEVYPDQLDRKALADIVFTNVLALKKLNNIAHPAVERDFLAWCAKQNTDVVFKEAAILIESGSNKSIDKIICVVAPEKLRIQRVIARDKCTAEQVTQRINNQSSDEEKIAHSDYVITTDEKRLVLPQAFSIIESILKAI